MSLNRRSFWLGIPALALVLTAFASIPRDDEIRAIRQAVQYYIDGHATGQREVMEQAFHESARLQSIRDGAVNVWPIEDYLAGSRGQPAADESERRRRVVSIDYHGTAAVAKIELDYPSVVFTDYMHLLKIGDEWKIVNKIYHADRK